MTDGLLEDIIQLEKRIQQQLADEQARSKAWQAQECAALAAALAAAQGTTAADGQQALGQARTAAETEAAALLQESKRWCEQLRNLPEQTLREVLAQQLVLLMPEADDDHPHGQG